MSNQDFEDPNFDAIAYLNKRFPDQESLVELDDEINKLNAELGNVNKQLIDQIHEHAMMNIQIGEQINKAKTLSKQIISEIGIIKEKAKKSQEIVYDMCKDLKSLDTAKKNLTFSIDALKKFIMMVDAIEKLREACEQKLYGEVANLLSAFNELSNHFKKYEQIPQIQDLYKDKNAIVQELFAQIKQDFEAFQNNTSLLSSENMAAAFKVIEVIDDKKFRQFIDWINEIVLREYNEQFGNHENAVLENTQKRYGKIKRKMQTFNQQFGKIIPFEWGIQCFIYYEFCGTTRLHLMNILQRTSHTVNVAVLMKALQLSIKFETKIAQLMKNKYGQMIDSNKKNNKKGSCYLTDLPKFTGSISYSFSPYLKPYIKSQEQALIDGLEKSLEDDKLTELKVFNSSIVLFHGIKNVIRRASGYSRGQLILAILKVIKKVFKIYSDKCFEKCSRNPNNLQETICWIINTGEYCKNIITGVHESLTDTIEERFADEIDFADEEEVFSNLISRAIQHIILKLQQRLQACFIQVTKVQWDQFDDFGEQSRYVKDAKEMLKNNFLKVKDEMQSLYLTLFVDKIIVLVANKYIQNVYKCKKLPETAFQVLLMDLTQLKQTLLGIVKMDQSTYGSQKAKQKHTVFVNKTFAKGQSIIKLMSFNNVHFAEKFETMMENATIQDLQKILQVRGGKKSQFPMLVKNLQNKYP